jgi:hypothetical protein
MALKPPLFLLLEVENRGLRAFTTTFFASKQGFKKNVRVAFEKRNLIAKNKPPRGSRELP